MTIDSQFIEFVIVFTTIVIIVNVFCEDMSDRRPYKTKEELEVTRSEPRIDGIPCAAHEQLTIFVLSAAQFKGKYFDNRQAVRQTWAKVAKEQYNVSVYFAIALSTDENINTHIKSEANNHSDIIQFSFIDDYYNLSLKVVSIFRWVSLKCPKLKYVLKSDDDAIVNIELLNRTLDQFESGIHGGGSMVIEKVPRTGHKNKVPVKYYLNDTYPKFVYGGAYLLSTDVIPKLLNTIDSYTEYVLDVEDSFITGIIAEKAGVARYWDSRFGYIWTGCRINDNNLCRMCSLIAWVQCKTAKEMIDFNLEWQQFDCNCILTSSLLLFLSILLIIIFFIVLIVVILFFTFKKNKTPIARKLYREVKDC